MATTNAAIATSSALAEEPLLTTPHWYAVHTRSRHEKKVADQLGQKAVEYFLPLYDAVHRWKDRRKTVQLPLFPGYIFVRIALREKLRVLELAGVVRLVGFKGVPVALPDPEIASLKAGLEAKLKAEPHPYLKVGKPVRVVRGPLAGREGILVRKKDKLRLVLSVDLIMRSMAVEVDAADVEPLR